MILVDAVSSRAMRGRRVLVIAGEHRDPADVLLPKQLDRLARGLARAIGDGNRAERARRRRRRTRATCRSPRSRSAPAVRRQRNAARLEEALVADRRRGAPSRRPSAPMPGTTVNRRHDGAATRAPGAWRAIAAADRMLGARLRRLRRIAALRAGRRRRAAATSVTFSSPVVSVPVLSNATTRTPARRSRCAPPLISTPFRAAAESAATIDTGVEITSAHGHAMTSSTSARYNHTGSARAARAAAPPRRSPPARARSACRPARIDRRTSARARAVPAPSSTR